MKLLYYRARHGNRILFREAEIARTYPVDDGYCELVTTSGCVYQIQHIKPDEIGFEAPPPAPNLGHHYFHWHLNTGG